MNPPPEVDPAADAALDTGAAALGRPLRNPRRLSGSGRSGVFRCREENGATVVVKTYPLTGEGPGSFAAEAAGLELASPAGVSPRLLAADPATATVVMSDLGDGATLADHLLATPVGDRADTTAATLLDWAQALGDLALATAGERDRHAALRARYLGGRADNSYMATLPDQIQGAGARAEAAGVTVRPGLAAELESVADLFTSDRYLVFSPGDECPDNTLLTPAGLRFLDFESAGFSSAFLDAAYLHMPFSTCWCVFRLPPDLAGAMSGRYRTLVSGIHPELADDAVWGPGVRAASTVWTLSELSWLLPRAQRAEAPMNSDATSPGRRQLIRYRWDRLAGELRAAGEWPATRALLEGLLAVTREWQAPELPLYPVFRS